MDKNRAYKYLEEQELAEGIVECGYTGDEYFILTDHKNTFTFNAKGILIATNE